VSEDRTNAMGNASDAKEEVTIVTIEKERAQAVIDFVAGLENDDDVSGHMLSLGRPPLGDPTGTGCWQTTTQNLGTDLKCSDSDKGGV
jgi:hypothetical protein